MSRARLLVLGLLASVISSSQNASLAQNLVAAPIKADTPCEFASALLQASAKGDNPFILSPRRFKPGRSEAPSTSSRELKEVVAKWNDQADGSLITACPLIASSLPANVRLATDEDEAKTRGIQHGPMIRTITVPVMNRARTYLLVGTGYHCGALCGGSFITPWVKTRDGWVPRQPISMIFS